MDIIMQLLVLAFLAIAGILNFVCEIIQAMFSVKFLLVMIVWILWITVTSTEKKS